MISLDIQTIQLLTGCLLEKSSAVLQRALWHPPSKGEGAYRVAHLSNQAEEHGTSVKHLCLVHQKKWMQTAQVREKGERVLSALLSNGDPRDLQEKLRSWMLLPGMLGMLRLKEGLSVG